MAASPPRIGPGWGSRSAGRCSAARWSRSPEPRPLSSPALQGLEWMAWRIDRWAAGFLGARLVLRRARGPDPLRGHPGRRQVAVLDHREPVPGLSPARDPLSGPVREPGALRPADGELRPQRLDGPGRPGAPDPGPADVPPDPGGRPVRPGPAVPARAGPLSRGPPRPSRPRGRGRSGSATPSSTAPSSSRRTTPRWPATS